MWVRKVRQPGLHKEEPSEYEGTISPSVDSVVRRLQIAKWTVSLNTSSFVKSLCSFYFPNWSALLLDDFDFYHSKAVMEHAAEINIALRFVAWPSI
jgi:hypothetical protein